MYRYEISFDCFLINTCFERYMPRVSLGTIEKVKEGINYMLANTIS